MLHIYQSCYNGCNVFITFSKKGNEMSLPAFAYGRYSTENQDDNTSMENQMLACKTYAENNELEIISEFCDNAVSGSLPMESRPEGRKMIKALENQNVKAIIFYVPDRASRGLINALVFRRNMSNRGVEVHYTNIGRVDGMTETLATFMDMISEQEYKTIIERLARGKRNTVILHKRMVLAVYSFGYTKIGKGKTAKLEINPEQARIVKMVFELYVYKNLSQMAIAERLNSLDIPTFTGKIPSQCPTGKAWFSHSINQMLNNPIYNGTYTYGKSERRIDPKTGKTKQYALPPEKWIYLDVPDFAIVSKEIWEKAQIRKEKNKTNTRWTSRNRGKFLLTSFITCPYCNRHIGGFTKKRFNKTLNQPVETYSYGCRNHDCEAYGRTIEQYKLDTIIWDWLKKQVNDEDTLVNGINKLFQIKQDKINDDVSRKDEITDLIKTTAKSIVKLTKSLAKIPEDDEITARALEKELSFLSKQQGKAEKDLRDIEFSHC